MKQNINTLLLTIGILVALSLAMAAQEHKWAPGKSSIDFIDDASMVLEKAVKKSKNSFFKKLYGGDLFYTPIWVEEKGLTRFGNALLEIIETDKTLLPQMESSQKYSEVATKLETIEGNMGGSLEDKVALELEMSRLYKAYVEYLLYGGINWTKFKAKLAALKKALEADFGWVVYSPRENASSVLLKAIAEGDLKKGIKKAEPTRFNYAKLKQYLLKYIEMQKHGSWEKLPKFTKKITVGNSDRAIPAIRHNLALEGDLGSCRGDMASLVYDECLQKAIKRFQLRNGLKADGVIGRGTYAKLAMPISQKIRLIRMNMDRIKRFRHDEAVVRMELNIPSFRLNIFDHDKLVDTIRVVTGKPNHPTPVFGNKVQYIVVNPWWKIPESIVKKEMLHHLIKDPYYYERKGKILKATWDENSERIDPGTVNWSDYTSKNAHIPYRFMQVPSRSNALGKIKFIFPNQFSVYIHDTPSKNLFFRTSRAFSHGCMRIQKPRELLKAFSLYNDNIDVEAIMKRLQGTEKKIINLKHKIPVDITYLTAFVDPYGNMNFRNDIYKYDKYTLKDYNYHVDKYRNRPTKTTSVKSKTKEEDGYQISEVYPK